MTPAITPGLIGALRRLNAARAGGVETGDLDLAEDLLDALFDTRSHLAAYGTLAPGAPNHSVVAELKGRWSEGVVRGRFVDEGWAASAGFPALRWLPEGDPVPVKLLRSSALRDEWGRLDEFEGSHYRRILVPVEAEGALLAVANLYEIGDVG